MLLRFRFSNYRSFFAEQELSMVATSISELPGAVIQTPAVREGVLPVAGIYGANASGKTNVLKALNFAVNAVRDSFRTWPADGPIPFDPFALKKISGGVPSRFVIDFVLEKIRYQYGFAMDSKVILEEWLHAYPQGRRQNWFVRFAGKPIAFSRTMPGENRTIERLTRANCLFLSAAAQHNHSILTPIHGWLANLKIYIDSLQAVPMDVTKALLARDTTKLLADVLRNADLGVSGLQCKRRFYSGIAALAPLEGEWSREFYELAFEHQAGTDSFTLPEHEESTGTLSYLSLLGPIIHALATGTLVIVDELDRSLHPVLARQIIQIFQTPVTNPKGAQLIFSSHDTNLLTSGQLRRDQIWFAEKDQTGSSRLYPLSDFNPRKDESLQSGYLNGRYGAIPLLNSRAFLESLQSVTHGKVKQTKSR